MGRRVLGGLTLAAVAGGALALRALVVPRRGRWPRAAGADPRPGRWQVVTVDRPPAVVLPGGRWPEPLRPLDGAVELRLRPAPGGRGSELAARPLGGVVTLPGMAAHLVGDDPGLFLRDVLRRVKQLTETGEVLRADRSAVDRPAVPG
ncbi:hypothetical protein AB0F73_08655 [Micromonospora purpureochromogenes]|uniref:hypothetical protein n=1 Tax=Micromonospora purpureochromogenes TaxID=47872 RepID=UPI0033D36418